jgi:formamidase
MHRLKIDRAKPLCDEPHVGHNRWHPDLTPLIEVNEGEEIAIETRDAGDGRLAPGPSGKTDFSKLQRNAAHPLTGPVAIKGAKPGDLLEIEFLDIIPEKTGFTAFYPGLGALPDFAPEPWVAHWRLKDGWATSAEIPGVRIPAAPFMGVSGVAPSRAQLEAWSKREADLRARGGFVAPPDPLHAVPAMGAVAAQGLRTIPPRENGGNMDVKQLTKGAKLFLPVAVEGALFSTGDAHYAQGDGEVCLTAIEMGATCVARFRLHKGEAARKHIRWPRFARSTYFTDPKIGMPERFIATVGMPVDEKGAQQGPDLNLACRNALLAMIDLLANERGFTRAQAYAICSVALDLKISNVVDVPNVVVSAFLPEAIFEG